MTNSILYIFSNKKGLDTETGEIKMQFGLSVNVKKGDKEKPLVDYFSLIY